MGIFGPKPGTYSTRSESDPRFNMSWDREGLVCWGIPDWIKDWAKKKAKELGLEDYPDDLQCNFWKD